LRSMAEARSVFHSQDPNMKSCSQCFQRAQLWSYELWTGRGIKTAKVFLFFTHRYIRNYDYGWWFHVSPFILVNNKELVLDRTFTGGPLSMKQWTDVFMRNNARCPTVARYSDYWDN